MPTYVYECSSCNKQFEIQQRITEGPIDTCECGSTGTVKRIIQPIAVVFKGSGFHINDYTPSKSDGAAPNSEPTTPATSESSAETKSPETPTSTPAATESTSVAPAAATPDTK